MANELKITQTVVYSNGQLKHTYAPGTIQLPQTTQGYFVDTVAVTTAEADVVHTAVATPGVMILQSLEATSTGNTVTYGAKSSTGGIGANATGKLSPKDSHVLRFGGTTASTLRMKSSAGTVNVSVILFEQ